MVKRVWVARLVVWGALFLAGYTAADRGACNFIMKRVSFREETGVHDWITRYPRLRARVVKEKGDTLILKGDIRVLIGGRYREQRLRTLLRWLETHPDARGVMLDFRGLKQGVWVRTFQ